MRARDAMAHATWAEPVDARRLLPLTALQLDAVMAIETTAYDFPWTRGNFIDSLAAGYPAEVLWDERRRLLGYYVAMAGVGEMHLLNITVAPQAQSRGHARYMLAGLIARCRRTNAGSLWLEVRIGNARARAIYARLGFVEVGLRRGYYPAPGALREDAAVLSLTIEPEATSDGVD